MDLKEIGVKKRNWNDSAQNRNECRNAIILGVLQFILVIPNIMDWIIFVAFISFYMSLSTTTPMDARVHMESIRSIIILI